MKTATEKIVIANKIWAHITNNQNSTTISGEQFGLSDSEMSKLMILRFANARDSFNQAVDSLIR